MNDPKPLTVDDVMRELARPPDVDLELFHAHLGRCARCHAFPFDPCGAGRALLDGAPLVAAERASEDASDVMDIRLRASSSAEGTDPRDAVRRILEVVACSDADDTLGSLSVEIPDGKHPRSYLQAAAERALASLPASPPTTPNSNEE
jgi:hypothetical protein